MQPEVVLPVANLGFLHAPMAGSVDDLSQMPQHEVSVLITND